LHPIKFKGGEKTLKKLICFLASLLLLMIPISVYAIHGGAAGEQTESKTETLKLLQNHDYLIFEQNSMKHFGIVYGGTSLMVEKRNNGWVYFSLDCYVLSKDLIFKQDTAALLAPNSYFFKESIGENIAVEVDSRGIVSKEGVVVLHGHLIDSRNAIGVFLRDTNVKMIDPTVNLVKIKGKIYMGTGKKPKVKYKPIEDKTIDTGEGI